MLNERLPEFVRENYFCSEWNHASAILTQDFPNEWRDIIDVLQAFRLKRSYLGAGGNRGPIAKFLDGFLKERGWNETSFDTKIVVDDIKSSTPTHKIDMFKNGVAFETEWNNKDPFFDRDLNNFRLLHQLKTVNVGIIVTRASELQDIFNDLGRGSSYGNSTTHLSKLIPRLEGGGAGGCPVLVFGIKKCLYREND